MQLQQNLVLKTLRLKTNEHLHITHRVLYAGMKIIQSSYYTGLF